MTGSVDLDRLYLHPDRPGRSGRRVFNRTSMIMLLHTSMVIHLSTLFTAHGLRELNARHALAAGAILVLVDAVLIYAHPRPR